MSLETRHAMNLDQVKVSLAAMRAIITRIGEAAPALQKLNAELRLEMMTLTSLVIGVQVTESAQVAVGLIQPMKRQEPVHELPIFAHGHTLTAAEIKAMERTLRRVGDDTELVTHDEEVRP